MNRVFALRAAVAALGIFVALIAVASWTMVGQAVVAERHPVEVTPADYGMNYHDVEFPPRMPEERAEDDPLTLKGWWIPGPQQQGGAVSAIIVVHGLDSTRVRDPDVYMPLLRDLRDNGFSLFLFDLRAHGESDGVVTSAGYYERLDVLGALDVVQNQYGVDANRIGALAFSLGGAATLLAATEEPRLQALVIDSSYANIDDLFAGEVSDRTPLPAWSFNILQPGMEIAARMRYGIRLSALKPEEFVSDIEYPILLIHSTGDERIPMEHSERIAAEATHPDTRLLTFESEHHAAAFKDHPEDYITAVTTYFKRRFE